MSNSVLPAVYLRTSYRSKDLVATLIAPVNLVVAARLAGSVGLVLRLVDLCDPFRAYLGERMLRRSDLVRCRAGHQPGSALTFSPIYSCNGCNVSTFFDRTPASATNHSAVGEEGCQRL